MFNDVKHISRRRSRKFDQPCAPRILKPQLMCVQHLPSGTFNGPTTVQRVTQERVPQTRQMGSNLVCSASF
jgi:hypothetical protein